MTPILLIQHEIADWDEVRRLSRELGHPFRRPERHDYWTSLGQSNVMLDDCTDGRPNTMYT